MTRAHVRLFPDVLSGPTVSVYTPLTAERGDGQEPGAPACSRAEGAGASSTGWAAAGDGGLCAA